MTPALRSRILRLFCLAATCFAQRMESKCASNAFSASQWNGNSHFYELVTTTLNWNAARAAAWGRSHLGLQVPRPVALGSRDQICVAMQGYLATITSQAESDFIMGELDTKLVRYRLVQWRF